MSSDSPIVEQVRRVREQISEECGHDIHQYFQRLQRLEAQYAKRLVSQLTGIQSSDSAAGHTDQR